MSRATLNRFFSRISSALAAYVFIGYESEVNTWQSTMVGSMIGQTAWYAYIPVG